jgi:hypothetical protein
MKPFVYRSESDHRWYVDASRWNPANYRGTAWGGYDTWREAFDAAVVARFAA